jgi:Bifunctional DNA primase/polymerase, N-terminal
MQTGTENGRMQAHKNGACPPGDPGGPAVLRAALFYLGRGLSVIPVRADGTKRPALPSWARFQTERATAAEVTAWFQDGRVGIAIICGRVSGGLVVLDFDGPEAWGEFRMAAVRRCPQCLDALDREPRVKTPGGGRHVYLRPDQVEGNEKLARLDGRATFIETRGEGGYVLAPGSPAACHISGRVYEWEVPLWG